MNSYLLRYLAALLILGSNGIVASLLSASSTQIVLIRTFLGSLLLFLAFIVQRGRFCFYKNKHDCVFLILSGILQGLMWIFLHAAYNAAGVGVASLIYYSAPVLVLLLSPLLFHEKLTLPVIVGFFTVMLGVLLVNGLGSAALISRAGLVYAVLSALCFAFMVITQKLATGVVGLENSLMQVFISFLTVAAVLLVRRELFFTLPRSELLPAFIIGAVNTALACYLYFSSIKGLKVQTVSLLGYLEPLSAVVFSALLLRERMSIPQIVGAALILCGAVATELFMRRKAASV